MKNEMLKEIDVLKRPKRIFLPEDFKIKDWESLKPFLDELLERELDTEEKLWQWFKDKSELEAVLEEDAAWRYINMTCDTNSEKKLKAYEFFVQEIQPHLQPYEDKLNKKALSSPFIEKIDKEGFSILLRGMKKEVELFREENIPLFTQLQTESQKFGAITGAMTVEVDGEEKTLQQASVYLKSPDRNKREEVYRLIAERRLQDAEKLDALFTSLIEKRDQVGRNAGFENYRDYMFESMGRFDYTPQDCFDFHNAIEKEVVPLLAKQAEERKEKLGVDPLRPWDGAVDPEGKEPLKPVKDGEELIEKSIECFYKLDDYLGERLAIMRKMEHLDLDSRKGKAPGGYNYPLDEIGVPFIFMNSSGQVRDLVTMVHEGGHAVHSFVTRDLELTSYKHTPSEVAELASMSMELISMDHWDLFFDKEEDLIRAKREHLEDIVGTLPWVATIDAFQHWIYENPNHTIEDRNAAWNKVQDRFSSGKTSWEGLQQIKDKTWQKQLHLYEVPFYYIEYGMAQLGAIAVWKNYKENPDKGLKQYLDALKLGYTKSIGEIYETAGIKFDFTAGYIKELMQFLNSELEALK